MLKSKFDALFDQAAELHGHKCPSLYYGVKGTVTALDLAEKRNITVKHVIVQGKSKCIRDGAKTALEEASLSYILDENGCGVSLGDEERHLQLKVKDNVRERVNGLNEQLPVGEFQEEGLKYLRTLNKDNLFEVSDLKHYQFNHLLHKDE